MQEEEKKIYDFLESLSIPYKRYEHPAVTTVEEAAEHWKSIDASHCKNLFIRNQKGDRHFLVILEHTRELTIPMLQEQIKHGKMSFASERRISKYLGSQPGAVSPLGLINDEDDHVRVLIDNKLQRKENISFHPNVNTATVVIYFDHFIKFLDSVGNKYKFMDLPVY